MTTNETSTSAFSLQALPSRRKELLILITVGWALFTVFVLTVLGGLFPLQPSSLAWSQNLSRLVVDAGSLALVGLCLVRYGCYLRSLDLPSRQSLEVSLRDADRNTGESDISSTPETSISLVNLIPRVLAKIFKASARPQPPTDSLSLDKQVKDKLGMESNKLWVRRLAIAGAVGMFMLAPLQVVIFLRGTSSIDLGAAQATQQQRLQFERLETALRDAPADRLLQGWVQLKRQDSASAPAIAPPPSAQLDDLIAEAARVRDNNLNNLGRQVNASRFALGRDCLRVLLGAMVYSWAFGAFLRRA
jgi:hypothetical protein